MSDRKVFIHGLSELDWDETNDVVADTVREIFRISEPLRGPQDTGGVFLMTWNVIDCDDEPIPNPYHVRDEDIRVDLTVGVLGPNDAECPQIVREKAKRLLVMYSSYQHHSSWLSRDVANKKFGGAIMARDWVLSFSGCSEKMDEAICICTAVVVGLFNQTDAEYVSTISGNELFPKLMELVTAELN